MDSDLKGRPMSDSVLFSVGGASMLLTFAALAMVWPV
jgi:hypothetical protein